MIVRNALIIAAGTAILVGLSLTGCAGGAQQTGVDITQDVGAGLQRNLSAQQTSDLRAACMSAAPSLVAATSATAPAVVKNVAVYPYALCQEIVSGKTVDPTQQTPRWWDQVIPEVEQAAQLAGYILPVVLPLL